ncbi:MAG: phosphatase family protein, partial [Segetibacter sp.]|nr:phosphatase family protein [Segetibacter sp.]
MNSKGIRILRMQIIVWFFVFGRFDGYSQKQEPLIKKLDSLKTSTGCISNSLDTNPFAYKEVTKLTPHSYFALLASNIKQQVTLPLHTKKKNWIKVGAFAAFTTAVSFTNKPINKFAVNLHNNSRTVDKASTFITKFGGLYEIYTLGGLYAYGV